MNVLFLHQAFPAQFGRLALELTTRYGWRCNFLIESLSSCPTPTPAMLENLTIRQMALSPGTNHDQPTPWPQIHARFLEQCRAVSEAVRGWPELGQPDLVVAHGGRGAPTVFLPDVLDSPIVNYCEYYFANHHQHRSDISYRIDLPQAHEVAPFFPRCINAPALLALQSAASGYSATHWQKQSFPKRYWPRIEVHFDGIDTDLYRPLSSQQQIQELAGRSLQPGVKLVTYVARGLESMRGFDIFMKVAARLARERTDIVFAVVGTEQVHYGWDTLHTGTATFKQWVLDRVDHDPSRFLFLGHVMPEQLALILARSDLHIYLTVPFVLSWSLFNAMACGCVVLGSDVPPVREVIEPGVTGRLAPFFDVDQLVNQALDILENQAEHQPLGKAARRLIESQYSLEVCVPALRDYFERVAQGGSR